MDNYGWHYQARLGCSALHTIAVTGPGGFRRELELPGEADMERLEVELHKHFLEIRAPLR